MLGLSWLHIELANRWRRGVESSLFAELGSTEASMSSSIFAELCLPMNFLDIQNFVGVLLEASMFALIFRLFDSMPLMAAGCF